MSSDKAAETLEIRRAIILGAILPIVGCVAGQPVSTAAERLGKRISIAALRTNPILKLEVSAWARLASARDIQYEQVSINSKIPLSWDESVRQAFVEALESSLSGRGATVVSPRVDSAATPTPEAPEILLHGLLTAGFVYKTWTSSAYAPFVQVVLEARTPTGSPLYHRLYVASDRPFNSLMNSLPAENQFLLTDIDFLNRDSDAAIECFKALAAQLARRLSTELVA